MLMSNGLQNLHVTWDMRNLLMRRATEKKRYNLKYTVYNLKFIAENLYIYSADGNYTCIYK